MLFIEFHYIMIADISVGKQQMIGIMIIVK